MIRNLLIIMGVGLILAVVGLGGAFAVGGPAVMRDGWAWSFMDHDGDWVRVSRDGGRGGDGRRDAGPTVTRTLTWTGGDRLEVDGSMDVVFTQGPTASVTVEGPETQVERLRLENGRLHMADQVGMGAWRRSLRVTVTAPGVSTFQVAGSGSLDLRAVDVPRLTVAVSGSGDVDVQGQAQSVAVDVTGSGHADLTGLQVADADVAISGSGEVDVGPTGRAAIRISGSGDVDLTRRPAAVETTVTGSGEVNDSW